MSCCLRGRETAGSHRRNYTNSSRIVTGTIMYRRYFCMLRVKILHIISLVFLLERVMKEHVPGWWAWSRGDCTKCSFIEPQRKKVSFVIHCFSLTLEFIVAENCKIQKVQVMLPLCTIVMMLPFNLLEHRGESTPDRTAVAVIVLPFYGIFPPTHFYLMSCLQVWNNHFNIHGVIPCKFR